MKHCPQCELEFPDHFRFCGGCGAALTASVRCPACGELTGTEWPFCTKCGEKLSANSALQDEDTVAKVSVPHYQRGILSGYSEPETPPPFRWWHGAILGLVLLGFLGALGIGAWYLWSPERSIGQTRSQSVNNNPPSAQNLSTAVPSQPRSTVTPQQATLDHSADEEITRLRERRIVADSSENAEIVSALEQAESQYPTDYRFPYELSKLSIKGTVSHHEAFEPLVRAAEKAIDSGKAEEMLNSLMDDKDGDFYKLSHGHHEWEMFEQALRNKDKKMLKGSAH